MFGLFVVVVFVVWYVVEYMYEWDLGIILFWDNKGVVVFLLIVLFSYSIYIVVLLVEKSMVDKVKFGKVLVLVYVVSVLMKLFFFMCVFFFFGIYID